VGDEDWPLNAAVAEGIALTDVFGDAPWYAHLTRVSKRLMRLQPEMGIVAAQMAVEVFVEEVVRQLPTRRGLEGPVAEAMLACLPDRSLMDRRSRELWTALTGDSLSQADAWKGYHRHIELRNRVVHGGVRVEQDDARESLEACLGLIQHMQKTLGIYQPLPKTIVIAPDGAISVVFGHLQSDELPVGTTAFLALDKEIVERIGGSVSDVIEDRARRAAARPVGTTIEPDEQPDAG
jgi:hypothetical protein